MSTLAVVGAGPGLGAAVARRFAAEGFAVGLIARDQGHLDALAAQLREDGVTAQGFAADVRDPASLAGALERVAEAIGTIEVLQYSPLPAPEFLRPVLETGASDLEAALRFSALGSVAAVEQVLPGLRPLGGSILFVNGGSAATANPAVAGTSIAFAAQAVYAQLLHDALADDGVYVGQLIIPGAIVPGDPQKDPAVLADLLWTMHRERGAFRRRVGS